MTCNAYALIVVPASKVATARAYASTFYGETQTDAFTVPLSASGNFPATSYCTLTGVDTAIRGRIGSLPTGVYWWAYDFDGNLIGSNVANPPQTQDVDACLNSVGLKSIPRDDL